MAQPPDHAKAPRRLLPLRPTDPSKTGVLMIRLHEATGPHPGSALRLPAELTDMYAGDDFTDPEAQRQWVPRAVLEYEGTRTSALALAWTEEGHIHWREEEYWLDGLAPSAFTVYLMMTRSGQSERGPCSLLLGRATIDPVQPASGPREVTLCAGIGKLRLEVAYKKRTLRPPHEDMFLWWPDGHWDTGDLLCRTKGWGFDTPPPCRRYGQTTIHSAGLATEPPANQLGHPFLAPLAFVFKNGEDVDLLSYLGTDGNLFNLLQQERRFTLEKTQFYAAEIACVLAYLHEQHIVACLKPEYVQRDPFGHISLCAPGLFALEREGNQAEDCVLPNTPLYPAPEVLSGSTASRVADWWTLGVFVYEMLTGLPPFYHKHAAEREAGILGERVRIPADLSPLAKDLLVRLLDKDCTKRLGTNGASEVKLHVFFEGIDWDEIQQKSLTTFISRHPPRDFRLARNRAFLNPPSNNERREVEGFLEEYKEVSAFGPHWAKIARVRDKSKDNDPSQAIPASSDDGWDVVWDLATHELRFRNRWTNEDLPARLPDQNMPPKQRSAKAQEGAGRESPNSNQWREALGAALMAGYSTHVFSQILEHGVELNAAAVYDEEIQDTDYLSLNPKLITFTPLEWAAEHDRTDLIRLFLDAGADANWTEDRYSQGPALIKAARTRNARLTALLAPYTEPNTRGRALCVAVEKKAPAVVDALLVAGAPCDGPAMERRQRRFTPPLVLAVRGNRGDLVQTLLTHGADPNLGYHGLPNGGGRVEGGMFCEGGNRDEDPAALPMHDFDCGRPVQLAMELGHVDMVRHLIDAGADVALPQPIWPADPRRLEPAHVCETVPRNTYLEVTAALRAIVA